MQYFDSYPDGAPLEGESSIDNDEFLQMIEDLATYFVNDGSSYCIKARVGT